MVVRAGHVPVVVYYRCSSPQQELSVDEQRVEVEAYCKIKGYVIVREYVDEGKSASKNPEKRVAFQQMIKDSFKKDFRFVVCYDAARFTRLHNHKKDISKAILMENGIAIDTCKEGVFDLNTPEGRWKDMAYCENNWNFALNLSKDSIRGRKEVLRLGFWPLGRVPYAYDRLYTDGERTMFIRRNEKFRKGRNWHLKLVINEEERLIVEEIFRRVLTEDISDRALAAELTQRGVAAPTKQGCAGQGYWDGEHVRTILRNKAYIGIAVLGKDKQRNAHNHIEETEKAGACPPIIDEASFAEVQQILDERQGEGRGQRGGKKQQYHRAAHLSGFVVCGHCHKRMRKHMTKGRVKFLCETARNSAACRCRNWGIYEDELLPEVASWLLEEVDIELLKALQAKPSEDNKHADEELLKRQIEDLEAKVNKYTVSALEAPAASRERAWALAGEQEQKLTQAREQLSLLQALRTDPELKDFSTWWYSVKDKLVVITNPPPKHVKQVVKLCEWASGDEADRIRDELSDNGICLVTTEQDGLHVVEEGGIATGTLTRDKIGRVWLEEGHYDPECEPIFAERDQLRALLTRLGFTVKLWWRHDPEARKHDPTKSEWIVCQKEINVRVKPQEISVSDVSRHSTATIPER